MTTPATPAAPLLRATSHGPYTVSLARSEEQLRSAWQLRHRVFSEEFGARLPGSQPGLDTDWFDSYCDHLVVTENGSGAVVGTYRLLPPERVRAAGRRYSEDEFDLSGLADIQGDLVEAGRSCVHPDHRGGAVVSLMWSGIARYLLNAGHNWLGGCCSVSLDDGGELARSVRLRCVGRYLAGEEHRVTPRRPWLPAGPRPGPGPLDAAEHRDTPLAPLPALLRGYLRLGARVCGEPAHDPDFDSADFYVLLSLRDVNHRYLRHFLGPLFPEMRTNTA